MEATFRGFTREDVNRINEAMVRGKRPHVAINGDIATVHCRTVTHDGVIQFSISKLADKVGKALAKGANYKKGE